MLKLRSIRTLTTLAAAAALATVVGCSKNDKDDAPAKTPAPVADKAPAPAADKAPAQTAPEVKTDAKLLALKFHHDD